jgi:hypothetical protein
MCAHQVIRELLVGVLSSQHSLDHAHRVTVHPCVVWQTPHANQQFNLNSKALPTIQTSSFVIKSVHLPPQRPLSGQRLFPSLFLGLLILFDSLVHCLSSTYPLSVDQ